MPPPTRKDDWLAQFESRLQELRPDLGSKFSHVIANMEWRERNGVDPRSAAQRWAAKSAKSAKSMP